MKHIATTLILLTLVFTLVSCQTEPPQITNEIYNDRIVGTYKDNFIYFYTSATDTKPTKILFTKATIYDSGLIVLELELGNVQYYHVQNYYVVKGFNE